EVTYLRGGDFDPVLMLDWVRERAAAAKKGGASGYRFVGEVICVATPPSAFPKFLEYEARLDDLLRALPAAALCAYDLSRIPASHLREAIATHSTVVVKGRVHRSPHHVDAEDFLAPDRPAGEVVRLLERLAATPEDGETRGASRRSLE